MIGSHLVPALAESRYAPAVVFVAAVSTVLLSFLPIEVWVLPLLVMTAPRGRALLVAAEGGVLFALIALFATGRLVGDAGVVWFLRETSGAQCIAAFQGAREALGSFLWLVPGWVAPSARDTALMAGQRPTSVPIFVAFSVLHVVLRGVCLQAAALYLGQRSTIAGSRPQAGNAYGARALCSRFVLPLWFALLLLSLALL